MGFRQQPQCSWKTSTLQVERVPSNSTAETLCRTVGMYLPPHMLSSCLHTVNYPTVSRASSTQFPPGSVDSDSFVSPVSGSSLPPGHTGSAQAHTSISHVTISSLTCKLFFLCTSSNLPSKCPPHCKVIFSKATLMLSVRSLVTVSVHSLQDQSTLVKPH